MVMIAVGMPVTRHPPHRSVRADFPHTAPTSGVWRKIAYRDTDARFVAVPGDSIAPRGRLTLKRIKALAQSLQSQMVEQGGEPKVLIPLCCLTHTLQPTRRRPPALRPGCGRLEHVPLGQRPSLHPLPEAKLLLVRGFPRCRVGGGRAVTLPPSARSNGSCSFPASRFPMWVALRGEGWIGFRGRGGSAVRGRSL